MENIEAIFYKLPDGYYQRAISNLNPKYKETLCPDIKGALLIGIDWSDSPEGFRF